MNFFKSILSDEPDTQELDISHGSVPESPTNLSQNHQEDDGDPYQISELRERPISNPDFSSSDDNGGAVWSFGGLIDTFATRSESVLETYRRDLQEFGSGLKKETDLFREAARRAAKDLPSSIEVGASVAHESIESIRHVVDGVLKSTAEIISHGKETILLPSDVESDTPDNQSSNSRRYSWFDAQLRAIQTDTNTYCQEPEDLEEYNNWKLGFVLEEKNEEVENLIEENGAMAEIYEKVVPNIVDRDTFWCRYFYKVHKLNQQKIVRAQLVKRAISIDDEEELTWDVDDDEVTNGLSKDNALESNKDSDTKDLPLTVKKETYNEESPMEGFGVVDGSKERESIVVSVDNSNVVESSDANVSGEELQSDKSSKVNKDELALKFEEKVTLDGKANQVESCKDSDV